jgi:hypothetical protein
MISGLKFRLIIFELAILTVTLAIGWAGYQTVRKAYLQEREVARSHDRLRRALAETRQQYQQIADRLSLEVEALDVALADFAYKGDADAWRRFQQRSGELRAWIDAEGAVLTKGRLVQIMHPLPVGYDWFVAGEIRDELESYVAKAGVLKAGAESPVRS